MQYLDKLKKERSLDRFIFLAGVVLAFIGFIVPTVYVKDEVPAAVTETVAEETTDYESTEVESEELSEDAEADDLDYTYAATDEDDDFAYNDDIEVKTYLKNIFGAAAYFNRAPSAFNATFLVICWLSTIAGIVLFFVTKTIIGDVIAVLIGLAFGIASVITIAPTLSDEFGAYAGYYAEAVTPFFGYASVGSYLVVIGLIVATVGTVLGAAHIQHPNQARAAN